MNPIKIFHTGDGHFSRENQLSFFQSATFLLEKAKKEQPDLIVIAGDLFDRAINDTVSSGFTGLVRWISSLMNIAPVVTVYGTPTHDIYGCYDVFESIKAQHEFRILNPSIPYFLDNYRIQPESNDHTKLLILGLPEPSKEWFLKDKQLGKAESDEAINQGMREMLLGMGAVRKQYPDIPCLFVGHIEVRDTPTCTGHIIQGGIKIGKDDLALVGADYYALGHIHLAQKIEGEAAYYCGSMFPVNWGELDQKGFNVVELTGDIDSVEFVPFPHPPRKKIVVDWPVNETWGSLGLTEGYDTWVQIRATKEERPTIDVEKIKNDLFVRGAGPNSRIEVITIPTETVRSEQISEATSLTEKLKVYAELSGPYRSGRYQRCRQDYSHRKYAPVPSDAYQDRQTPRSFLSA